MEGYKSWIISLYEEIEKEILSKLVENYDEKARYELKHEVFDKTVMITRSHDFFIPRLNYGIIRVMSEKVEILNRIYVGKSYEYAVVDISDNDDEEENPITEMIIYFRYFNIELINNNGTDDISSLTSVDPEWVIKFNMICSYNTVKEYYLPYHILKDDSSDNDEGKYFMGSRVILSRKTKEEGDIRGNIIGGVGAMLSTLDFIRDRESYEELSEYAKNLEVFSTMKREEIIRRRPSQIPPELLSIKHSNMENQEAITNLGKILTDAVERYSEENLMNIADVLNDKNSFPWPKMDKHRIITLEDYRNFLNMFLRYHSQKEYNIIRELINQLGLLQKDILLIEDVVMHNIMLRKGEFGIVYKTFDELLEDVRFMIITDRSSGTDMTVNELIKNSRKIKKFFSIPDKTQLSFNTYKYDSKPIPGTEEGNIIINLTEIPEYEEKFRKIREESKRSGKRGNYRTLMRQKDLIDESYNEDYNERNSTDSS